ncbi:transmembrane protein, putative (macronuclear) [Tetrahymena thermophila SB210]|uniref:Transmembrane protein, putative n=1 Tax=Tetrahymena thermophila (strain SB210) TaxID=312017 RepID=Q23VD6_TETTS|nr:transmembrane protein, putative [Tetrahymena thermophila SB210]EAS00500.1 transmembrane protein, putative [Tetrahymena thermophila SB210]|eukprot:XP_001020745.1 transmembrane protein, putative [Tetrahymena thermophila SB210]
MRICAFILIALVAITAAQFDTLTQDQIKYIEDCAGKVDPACEIYTEDCITQLEQADQCFDQCSLTDIHNMTVCTQGCKSNNNSVQAHIEQKTACMSILEKNPSNNNENKIPSMSTGINILAFTVIASVLSVLL